MRLIASRVSGIDAVVGYAQPNSDPVGRPLHNAVALLRGADGLRPFARGFRTLAMLAAQKAAPNLRVLPLGLRYRRTARGWSVRAGLGAPLRPDAPVADVERAVRELSG